MVPTGSASTGQSYNLIALRLRIVGPELKLTLSSLAIRVDLHEALKRLAVDPSRPGNPATIKVASKVVSCDCEQGVVHLENGETVQGDLIVGADGM